MRPDSDENEVEDEGRERRQIRPENQSEENKRKEDRQAELNQTPSNKL